MNDLYLKYQFTDRAGRRVYTIAWAEDKKNIIGQIRLLHGKDSLGTKVYIDWVEPTNCIPTEK